MLPEEGEPSPSVVPAGVHLAPFWRRIVGFVVDQVLVVAPVLGVCFALGYRPDDDVTNLAWTWFNVAVTTIALCYETIAIAGWGRTVGKLVAGTRVVDAIDGGRVIVSSALLRSLVPAALGVIPQVGMVLGMLVYGWAFLDPFRQGVHDKAAGTLVALAPRRTREP